MEERFDVRFGVEAEKEYDRLDHSVRNIVNKAIDELLFRADEVGKVLSNHNETKLHGCKEIKLRDAGVRIIYRITNELVDVLQIVYILTIEQRVRDRAFKVADKRLSGIKRMQKRNELKKFLTARRKLRQP